MLKRKENIMRNNENDKEKETKQGRPAHPGRKSKEEMQANLKEGGKKMKDQAMDDKGKHETRGRKKQA